MTFINADGGALLNVKDQEKVLGKMSNENTKYIRDQSCFERSSKLR